MTSSQDWEIPRKIWTILALWGVASLMIAGLLSFWIWNNDQDSGGAEPCVAQRSGPAPGGEELGRRAVRIT
jgi:hypothetical protein